MIETAFFTTVSVAGAILLLGVAMVTILCALLRHLAFPAMVAVALYTAVFLTGIPVLFAGVSTAVGWGMFAREDTIRELRAAVARISAIKLENSRGAWVGVLPTSLIYPDSARPPFVATRIGVSDIPPVFWACAVALENTRLNSHWAVDNIDAIALLRAWVALFTPGGRREGGSTLAEMVARELRGLTPHPRAPLLDELGRKWRAWRDAPAVAALFPGDRLEEAVATYLPLVAGAKGSKFGSEIHGLALAAHAAFAKDAVELNDGEAALLAAAINKPLLIASNADPFGVAMAGRRLGALKRRAGFCLTHAPFPAEFDRTRARAQLAVVPVPMLGDPATDGPSALAHPEHSAERALGRAIAEIPGALRAAAGPDWRETVKTLRVITANPAAALVPDLSTVIKKIEQRHVTTLEIPLWEGPDHALVAGAIIDGTGAIVTEISNTGGFTSVGPQPIGSVAKIVASVLRASSDTPRTRYPCPSPECQKGRSYSAFEAFGLSKSATILRRLKRNSEEEAQAGFAAFGFPAPPAGSARYNAVFGVVETKPDQALRAAALLTGIIAGRPSAVPLPHVITEIVLDGGVVLRPSPGVIEPKALEEMLASRNAHDFVAQVLSAPIKMGTLRDVIGIAKTSGIASFWGKTGTAESADHRVRVLWNVVGVTYRGRQLTALMVVAGSNSRPLGRGIAASAIAPLTSAFLYNAIKIQPMEVENGK